MTQLAFDGSNPLDDVRLAYSSIPNWYALRIFYNRIEPLRQTLDVAAIRYFYPHHWWRNVRMVVLIMFRSQLSSR